MTDKMVDTDDESHRPNPGLSWEDFDQSSKKSMSDDDPELWAFIGYYIAWLFAGVCTYAVTLAIHPLTGFATLVLTFLAWPLVRMLTVNYKARKVSNARR